MYSNAIPGLTQERRSIRTPFAIAAALLGSETVLSYCLITGWMPLPIFFIGHAAITCVLALWPLQAKKHRRDLTFPLLFVILNGTMGIFGAGICTMMTLLYSLYARHSSPFADWYASLFPQADDKSLASLHGKLAFGWEDTGEKLATLPYMDIITLGTEHQKRIALETIARHFTPELTPVITKALEDPSYQIRVQAATILARLERGFIQIERKLARKIRKHPHSPKTSLFILQLARHYDTYAHAGFVFEKEREQLFRDKAITLYEHYLDRNPNDKEAIFCLGRLYIKNRNLDEAYVRLRSCVENQEKFSPAMLWCYMECLYYMRHFDALKHVARTYFSRLDPDDSESFTVVEMVRLWGGGIIQPQPVREQAYG